MLLHRTPFYELLTWRWFAVNWIIRRLRWIRSYIGMTALLVFTKTLEQHIGTFASTFCTTRASSPWMLAFSCAANKAYARYAPGWLLFRRWANRLGGVPGGKARPAMAPATSTPSARRTPPSSPELSAHWVHGAGTHLFLARAQPHRSDRPYARVLAR